MTISETNRRWRYRRLIVFTTLIVCFLGIGYLTGFGSDSRLNETLAMGYFALAGSTIGAYVFGAVWDDVSLAGRHMGPRMGPRTAAVVERNMSDNEDETPNG